MGGSHIQPQRQSGSSPHAGSGLRSLEDQLASVVEQDGVTMTTPRGTRRKRTTAKTAAFESTPQGIAFHGTEDDVQILDQGIVAHAISTTATGQAKKIVIHAGEHERSPYVVSLQNIPLIAHQPVADERVHIASTHGAPPMGQLGSVQAYAAMSTDLAVDVEPHTVSDQFTPKDFDVAYDRVYGRFERVRQFFRDGVAAGVSFFQRVERVEQRAAEEIGESLAVFEVRRFSYVRALVGFAALALVITLPANAVSLVHVISTQKDAASAAGHAAVNEVLTAATADSVPASAAALQQASVQFRTADAVLSDTSALALGIASVLPKQYRSARALLEAGDKSSEAARLLALGFDKVFADPGRRLDERLDVLGAYARSAMALLSDANKAAATVDQSTIPEAQRPQATKLLSRLDQSSQAVREFAALADVLSTMAGKEHLRKYLVIFQNQTEIRPTGGFMGSFAEVTVDRGSVTSVRVPPGGTYDLQGQLIARVAPPKPLQLVNDLWQFQDANWDPDFPTSAEKIRWFWSKSGQSTVDGVVAINASFVERLLEVTGPIPMPEYGKIIDPSNFWIETQKAVELEYDKQNNTPKKFVGDLAAKVMERMKLFGKDDWLKVAQIISMSLETKEIQVALSNSDEEALAEQYGWNGRMKETFGDSLAVVEANIAGQKTDGVITEDVVHHADIAADGSIRDTVTLVRAHGGKKGDLFTGVRNVEYLRVYVPKGSVLISASGFKTPDQKYFQKLDSDVKPDARIALIEEKAKVLENGVTVEEDGVRTVFGGWMQLDPGETQTISLVYRLPMTASDILAKLDTAPERPSDQASQGAYLLLLTSQSGKTKRQLTTAVSAPASWGLAWSRPEASNADGLRYHGTWDRDQVLVGLYRTPHGQENPSQTRENQ